ncbi:bifunctional metallophosphatase/5'-nucleotidase [Nannocystis punicea]|uniref:5'-nucleotidase C-terminal domain-containing protein n=1 Tax=Nannocystis punicea TaxID=2995304 RepID=A0ABY7GWY6_9BACT|nr:5'-nucleotidase C-terminal domain-containing protein [Nannocystis poenicansa]WAS91456.1 5'-nucleotidase C-terminal domain-containing protein [Nannocystis poenicansa]
MRRDLPLRNLLLPLLGILACQQPAAPATTPPASDPATSPAAAPAPKEAVLLHINDTYRIEGNPEAGEGGMARVRALRTQLEQEHPTLLLTHGGDFLQPSFMSRLYGGDQMVDALNHLDGDGKAFDPRMFVVPGNHEFDKRGMDDGRALDGRVEASGFTWLSASVEFAKGENGEPVVAADNLVPRRLVESGGYKVGLFGLTLDSVQAEYIAAHRDRVAVAKAETAALRAEGADFVIALTHLDMPADQALLTALGAEGPDLILGGHEHNHQDARIGTAAVVKADADAATAAVVRLRKIDGKPQIDWEYVPLKGTSPAPDPALQAVVDGWRKKHEAEFCAKAKEQPACLAGEIGRTSVTLVGEELEIRRFETNLGNLIVDWMLESAKPHGAEVAFYNSGSFRLNRNLAAGPVTRQMIEELFAYPSPLRLIQIDGATLQKVAERSVSDWTGQGHFLQIAGFAFRFDPATGAVTGLSRRTAKGWVAVKPKDRFLAVTESFLVNPARGQDGYTMLTEKMLKKMPEVDLKQQTIERLKAAGAQGVAPTVDGRICNATRPGPCLAVGP